MTLTTYLASIGLVWIVKDSYILSNPREYLKSKSKHLNELLICSLCLGFWSGLLFSSLHYYINSNLSIDLLLFPLASSASCWLLDSALDLIQESTYCYRCQKQKDEQPNR